MGNYPTTLIAILLSRKSSVPTEILLNPCNFKRDSCSLILGLYVRIAVLFVIVQVLNSNTTYGIFTFKTDA